MPKIIINFPENDHASTDKVSYLLDCLRSGFCGLRSIAHNLRELLRNATITKE